jgi:hypothetical protein
MAPGLSGPLFDSWSLWPLGLYGPSAYMVLKTQWSRGLDGSYPKDTTALALWLLRFYNSQASMAPWPL